MLQCEAVSTALQMSPMSNRFPLVFCWVALVCKGAVKPRTGRLDEDACPDTAMDLPVVWTGAFIQEISIRLNMLPECMYTGFAAGGPLCWLVCT